ncbi:hypothetical protein GALMADRAFT_160877 [Galerina marginata CBS 339.88]|uniref:Transmembrane protein n=1 Tax=Galerina marginata (strain CBS 339.88) TaxID=685588 RepID=A0A067SC54_GALM3|nr:hypothetical protein GALMADRAFT_160877 [Galerina marginata CBS 339.88]
MSVTTRWIVVDDTDPTIQYTGAWFPAKGNLDNLGDNGPPFQGTSHGVNTNASLAFTFSGSRVQVYGLSQIPKVDDPSWACFVDGVGTGTVIFKDGSGTPSNNWLLCQVDLLPEGVHTVVVQATVLDPRNTFWFDRINYTPSASVQLDNATIYIDSPDSAIQYESGWVPLRDIGEMTQQNGGHMSFDFSLMLYLTGIQLSWFSMIPADVAIASASATYSIDGESPVSFLLAGLTLGTRDQYNQLFFQTPVLSPGKHHLEVVYGGDTQKTPLSLDYLVIQNATVPASSRSSAGSSAVSASGSSTIASLPSITSSPNLALDPSPNPTTKSSVPVGAIIGGAVGGIVVLISLILLLFFCAKARRRDKTADESNLHVTFLPTLEPFNVLPSRNSLRQQPARVSSFPPYSVQPTGKFQKNPGPRPESVIHQEDSRVRLPTQEEETSLELPPRYSPA